MDKTITKRSKFLITLLFVCLLAVIMTVSASSAASEVYVNTTDNDTNGVGSADNPYASISNGIENTDNNGILYIGEGTFTGEKTVT